jgi:hypothetical protein
MDQISLLQLVLTHPHTRVCDLLGPLILALGRRAGLVGISLGKPCHMARLGLCASVLQVADIQHLLQLVLGLGSHPGGASRRTALAPADSRWRTRQRTWTMRPAGWYIRFVAHHSFGPIRKMRTPPLSAFLPTCSLILLTASYESRLLASNAPPVIAAKPPIHHIKPAQGTSA